MSIFYWASGLISSDLQVLQQVTSIIMIMKAFHLCFRMSIIYYFSSGNSSLIWITLIYMLFQLCERLEISLTVGKAIILADSSYQRAIINTMHILKEYVCLELIVWPYLNKLVFYSNYDVALRFVSIDVNYNLFEERCVVYMRMVFLTQYLYISMHGNSKEFYVLLSKKCKYFSNTWMDI